MALSKDLLMKKAMETMNIPPRPKLNGLTIHCCKEVWFLVMLQIYKFWVTGWHAKASIVIYVHKPILNYGWSKQCEVCGNLFNYWGKLKIHEKIILILMGGLFLTDLLGHQWIWPAGNEQFPLCGEPREFSSALATCLLGIIPTNRERLTTNCTPLWLQ